jgi:hypothetical protein
VRGAIFVFAIACGGQTSPPRDESPPLVKPVPAPASDAAPAQPPRDTTGAMTLSATMTELIGLADSGPPAGGMIAHAFAARATKQDTAVSRPNDIVLALRGDVASMTIWEDTRGWGAYAELVVTAGTLADLETVVGPTTPMPRNPDDFHSGEKRAAYVTRAGKTIRVFAELDKTDQTQVRRVTVHFQR